MISEEITQTWRLGFNWPLCWNEEGDVGYLYPCQIFEFGCSTLQNLEIHGVILGRSAIRNVHGVIWITTIRINRFVPVITAFKSLKGLSIDDYKLFADFCVVDGISISLSVFWDQVISI